MTGTTRIVVTLTIFATMLVLALEWREGDPSSPKN
jgi:hypothetical protein